METEKTLFNATLVLPFTKTGKVVLGIKARKIGAGCWNGYGGGVDDGEGILESALRELKEEALIEAEEKDLEYVALIHFHNTKEDGTTFVCKMRVFLLKDEKWKGEIQETSEMFSPKEFDPYDLPITQMMLADRDWMPLVMQGKKILGVAYYGPHQKKLLKPTEVQEVNILEL